MHWICISLSWTQCRKTPHSCTVAVVKGPHLLLCICLFWKCICGLDPAHCTVAIVKGPYSWHVASTRDVGARTTGLQIHHGLLSLYTMYTLYTEYTVHLEHCTGPNLHLGLLSSPSCFFSVPRHLSRVPSKAFVIASFVPYWFKLQYSAQKIV